MLGYSANKVGKLIGKFLCCNIALAYTLQLSHAGICLNEQRSTDNNGL